MPSLHIRPATPNDVELILTFIQELADYERLSDQAVATADHLHSHLFGPRPFAEVLIGEVDGQASGFALFFHSYSTFLGKPGIYLEDLFVRESVRGAGLGKALLAQLAKLALARGCGRLEWSVLDWNTSAIEFYERLGARAQEEWTVYRLTGEALENAGQMALRSPDAV